MRHQHNNSQYIFAKMSRESAKYILLTGSNLGDRVALLTQAENQIEQKIGKVIARSTIVESKPWGFESESLFLNQALLIESRFGPFKILDLLQSIEADLGRVRTSQQWSSRNIDIDILCSDSITVNSNRLTIPHAQLNERVFALEPLCQLVPSWVNQNTGKTYGQHLQELLLNPEPA